MSKFAVVYWSGTGNTEQMANAVAEGIAAAGGQAEVFTAADFGPDKVPEYEGLAFGCPSMGSEELESDEFEPMFRAVEPSLAGKKVGLFGSYGWGDGEWMRTWQAGVEGDGCTLVADGVIANEAPDDEALAACRDLGAKLSAKTAKKAPGLRHCRGPGLLLWGKGQALASGSSCSAS